jgi:hypothetical protein
METLPTDENGATADSYNLKDSSSGNTATGQAYMHNGHVKNKPFYNVPNGTVYALSLPPWGTEKITQESIQKLGKQMEEVAETIAVIGGKGHDSQSLAQRQGQCGSLSLM